jgi:hypothetical protein
LETNVIDWGKPMLEESHGTFRFKLTDTIKKLTTITMVLLMFSFRTSSLFQNGLSTEDRLNRQYGAGRLEDRFGGDVRWEKKHRGGDEIYGENIYTKQTE